MKKYLKNIILFVMVVIILWFVASYIEIICKNTSVNPTYSDYNMIVNIINYIK